MSEKSNQARTGSIFKEFSSAIKGFIAKRVSSPNEAEDILHDLFYRFIVADGEDQLIDNVSAWLYRVARNLIIDSSRKKGEERMPLIIKRDGAESIEVALSELLTDEESLDSDPEQQIIRAMIREEIELALKELPDEQRIVFELNQIQGITFREISESCSVPINTLITRKRYAVEYLQRRLLSLYSDISS